MTGQMAGPGQALHLTFDRGVTTKLGVVVRLWASIWDENSGYLLRLQQRPLITGNLFQGVEGDLWVHLPPSRVVRISLPDSTSMSSFWAAAHQGDIDRLRELLDQGQDLDAYPPAGDSAYRPTALAYAVWGNQPDAASLLLECGANPNRPDGDENYYPLHWASYHRDHADCAQILVEAGADLDVRSYKGYTPLQLAMGHHAAGGRAPAPGPRPVARIVSSPLARFWLASTQLGHQLNPHPPPLPKAGRCHSLEATLNRLPERRLLTP